MQQGRYAPEQSKNKAEVCESADLMLNIRRLSLKKSVMSTTYFTEDGFFYMYGFIAGIVLGHDFCC